MQQTNKASYLFIANKYTTNLKHKHVKNIILLKHQLKKVITNKTDNSKDKFLIHYRSI